MCIRSLFICRSALSLWNIGDALVGASLSSWVVRSTCRKWIKSSQQHKNRTHNWGYPKKALNGFSTKESKIILCALLSSDKSNLQGLRPVGHVTAMARLRKGGTLGTQHSSTDFWRNSFFMTLDLNIVGKWVRQKLNPCIFFHPKYKHLTPPTSHAVDPCGCFENYIVHAQSKRVEPSFVKRNKHKSLNTCR
jgi:hypothetical protein